MRRSRRTGPRPTDNVITTHKKRVRAERSARSAAQALGDFTVLEKIKDPEVREEVEALVIHLRSQTTLLEQELSTFVHEKMTDEVKQQMFDLHKKGMSVHAIAKICAIGYANVHRWLRLMSIAERHPATPIDPESDTVKVMVAAAPPGARVIAQSDLPSITARLSTTRDEEMSAADLRDRRALLPREPQLLAPYVAHDGGSYSAPSSSPSSADLPPKVAAEVEKARAAGSGSPVLDGLANLLSELNERVQDEATAGGYVAEPSWKR